ncbi:Vacuolar membrane-associated protein iml1 [Pleurostoma richardsiae]|uniref:Vacuolar membrane-associated protein IML1 n=1 Tax=Pleurostoma richardsiae TaxID=41990 RepID=A0AA38R8H5_9PEZI|nr:Vacuolar membrane-associated protein iml1 [Pleurostoma richardsiae]
MSRNLPATPSGTARRPLWSAHLRQFSRTSLDKIPIDAPPRSPDTVSSNSTVRDVKPARMERVCTVTVNESFARDEVLMNLDLFENDIKPGTMMSMDVLKPETDKAAQTTARDQQSQGQVKDSGTSDSTQSRVDGGKRYIFFVKDMPKELKARFPGVELYVAKHIADAFGMKKGSQVLLMPVDDTNPAMQASHVELSFKDQYLSRSDMWRIAVGELADRTVYKGQMMLFMGTIKAQVTAVFVEGRKVQSAFFGKNTRPIFRSESARYVLFIQMALEMWHFDSDGSGEIMFNKVVNGFLPALFKKWAALKVKHLVSIVLFARMEYDVGLTTEFGSAALRNDYYTGVQPSGDKRPYKDFYRVVVSEMGSGEWTKILYQLKREFNYFRRDISLHHVAAMDSGASTADSSDGDGLPANRIKAEASRAMYGNVLEAINMASSLFAHDYIDRDLMRTGISIVIISPGPGVFEVEYDTLRRTTEALVGNGIGIDLICIPKIPLHSVPLFRYRNPAYSDGRHSTAKLRLGITSGSTPKQPTPLVGSYSSISSSLSPSKGSGTELVRRHEPGSAHSIDEWIFALPQWLHISYWTGTSDEALSFQGIALSVADQEKQEDEFIIRCRMYDLQMRSVLETNEIETTPLHADPVFPQKILQSTLARSPEDQDNQEFVVVHNRRVSDVLYDQVHGFQKFVPDRHAKPGEKTLWKLLQEYDDARSRLPASRRATHPSRHVKELEDGTRRRLLEDTRLFVIKSSQQSFDVGSQIPSGSFLSSTLKPRDFLKENPDLKFSDALRAEDAQKMYNSKLLAGAVPELPATLSPTTALSPWLTVLNPSNPDINSIDLSTLYSRWQHVFVRPSEMRVMKWKSLCSPAAVPLTTEYFPSKTQFDNEYQRQPYNVSQNTDDDMLEEPRTRQEFLRELIGLRFSQGFQVVIGPAVAKAFGQRQLKLGDIFSRDHDIEDGTSIFMAVGNTIHQLSCVNGTEVEVTIFIRKPTESAPHFDSGSTIYKPAIRTLLDHSYETSRIDIINPRSERNWNYIDSYIAGHDDEMSENLRFWRTRYVLIPVSTRGVYQQRNGDDEEETRIEGIKYLAQQWHKHRYVPPAERRFQVQGRRAKDLDPHDIVYKTEDPSVVIAAELETLPLLEGQEGGNRKGQLVTNRELFKKGNFSISALAEMIQQPVENGGVRMQNRRWHLRLHYNCFIGSDMTTWLLDNFEDLESREEAEALGNSLMVREDDRSKDKEKEAKEAKKEHGLFVHVEKRHPFRDGQYFYQISSEYAKPHPPGWFNSARKGLVSVPSTPMSEHMARDSPRSGLSRPTSIHEENSPLSGATTPTAIGSGKKPRVVLSRVMKYDADPRKRSYRPERVDLHYDRLHNPDNCYHIRIDWMNTTAKLIEDAVESWARDAAKFGLRLVEVPIAEACSISEINPFRRPYRVKLAITPPNQQPITYYEPNSFMPQAQPGRHFYQKAILRKFDFVLDVEAASNFPANVDVSYSWGKPDFKYTQYIHRSGAGLAEITDEGDFLLLANRLYSSRAAMAARERGMRTEQQGAMDRAGPLTGGRSAMAAYTPYGIAEPTPMSSPLVRPAVFSPSPVLKPAGAPGDPFAARTAGGVPDPESIKDDLEAFCGDAAALEVFYRQALETGSQAQQQPASTPGSMHPVTTTTLGSVPETSIPALGLPPNLLGAGQGQWMASSPGSPSPGRMGSPGVNSPAMMSASQLLRRGSVQPDR